MGSLSLNRKRIFDFALGGPNNIESFNVKFLGAPSNIIGLVLDPEENQNKSNGVINIYEGGINGTVKSFYSDIFDWYDSVFQIVTNTYSIPANSIITFTKPSFGSSTYFLYDNAHNYVGYFEKYDQGKTSIKKQNLTSLKSISYYNDAFYLFKSANNNTISQIFDATQFEPYADSLQISNLDGYSFALFLSDGSNWMDFGFENQNNYIIPSDKIITFSTSQNIDISVGGGAIIQKLYSGKINAK